MRAGMDERTGRLVTGWDHVLMIIRRCLSTRPATLVLRRPIGSDVPGLQDQNMSAETILRHYIAIARALSPLNPNWGEPGFRLRSMQVELAANGSAIFRMAGDYYPRGHLGDYSETQRVETALPLREIAA
ncbi:MAG: baseplate assembly protein [Rhabdaerophilum sp.]